MTIIEYGQAYVIFGLLFGLTVNLVNGTLPRPLQLVLFGLGWPYFFYRGFIKGK